MSKPDAEDIESLFPQSSSDEIDDADLVKTLEVDRLLGIKPRRDRDRSRKGKRKATSHNDSNASSPEPENTPPAKRIRTKKNRRTARASSVKSTSEEPEPEPEYSAHVMYDEPDPNSSSMSRTSRFKKTPKQPAKKDFDELVFFRLDDNFDSFTGLLAKECGGHINTAKMVWKLNKGGHNPGKPLRNSKHYAKMLDELRRNSAKKGASTEIIINIPRPVKRRARVRNTEVYFHCAENYPSMLIE